MANRSPDRRFSRPTQALLVFAGIIVVLLLAVRFAASPVAERMVNRKLSDMPNYTGKVGALQLAIWRGAIDVQDFTLSSRESESAAPLVRIKRATVVFSWSALFRGKAGGHVVIDEAEIATVKDKQFGGPREAGEEAGKELKEKLDDLAGWQQVLTESFPMEITKVHIRNSKLHFTDRSHDPEINVTLTDIDLQITGLTNRPNGDELPAKLVLTGRAEKSGELRATVMLDPLSKVPRFTATFEVKELSLPEVNDFLQAYVNADVSRGTFEMYAEVEAKDGGYYGYIKPFFKDLDFKNITDKNKSAVERLKEKAVAVVASVLKNDEKEKVATKAPFAGSFEDGDVDIWRTIQFLFRNAFVQALREGLDGETPTA